MTDPRPPSGTQSLNPRAPETPRAAIRAIVPVTHRFHAAEAPPVAPQTLGLTRRWFGPFGPTPETPGALHLAGESVAHFCNMHEP